MLRLKFGGYIKEIYDAPLAELAKRLSTVEFCYAVLNKVSRSFSVVIQQLPEQLKDPICIFYLVLRGLDSIEDDMTVPVDRKLVLLVDFHNRLSEDGWSITGIGDGPDYRVLLANFEKVIVVYKSLDHKYQAAIKDITKAMGQGMAQFASKTTVGVSSLEQYDLYCHYVAGLVGHGLSRLFSASGLEDRDLQRQLHISNSMGLFLQKTNIIRDYLEDLDQGRTWWPEEIWGKYAATLGDFKQAPTAHSSISCLNHMVMNALEHVSDCIDYMSLLHDPKVFQFCAIPQVMAIATLAACYNNPKVFTQVVKLRKGLSCKMMLDSTTFERAKYYFYKSIRSMQARVPENDPNRIRTIALLAQAESKTRPLGVSQSSRTGQITKLVALIIFLIAFVYLTISYASQPSVHSPLLLGKNHTDFAAWAACALSLGFLSASRLRTLFSTTSTM